MNRLRATLRRIEIRRRDLVSTALGVPPIVLLIRQTSSIEWLWIGVGGVVVLTCGWVFAFSRGGLAAWSWFTHLSPTGRGLVICGWAVLVVAAGIALSPPGSVWRSFIVGLFTTTGVVTVLASLAGRSTQPVNATRE